MSRENVELARWAFTSDPNRFFSLLAEDIELDARGHVELPGAALAATWTEYCAEPQESLTRATT